ncbi:MAG: hypothetical protein GF332_03710 [Candidatus Moranbacteria bacterium]|nr:hypothetical protein [Candidatus Moranbacteria bacterium]
MAAKGVNFAKQTAVYRDSQKRQNLYKNFFIALIIMLISFGVYGGAFSYKKIMEGRVSSFEKKIKAIREARNYNNYAKTLDTSMRLDFANDMAGKQKLWSGFLEDLEDNMLPVLFLESMSGTSAYKPDGSNNSNNAAQSMNQIELEVVAPHLSEVAKQIHAFQEMDLVESVIIEEVSKEDLGLKFTLQLQMTEDGLDRANYDTGETDDFIDVDSIINRESEDEGLDGTQPR